MTKAPEPETLEKFRRASARRSVHSGEPRQDVGPSRADMVKIIENLASGEIHGTVIKRLRQLK